MAIILGIIELALVGVIIAAPGAGHSPLLYTQLPALLVAAWIDPGADSCITCTPVAWCIGVVAELALLVALGALLQRATRSASVERAA